MEAVQEWGIRAMAITVMLTIGLELELRHLTQALKRPLTVATGLLINILAMPAIAYLFWKGFGLEASVGLGLMLTAASPGGPVGALLTQHARGELGLAVALIFLTALTSTAWLPLLTSWFGAGLLPASVPVAGPVLTTLLVFQILPLALAMGVRQLRPQLADRIYPTVVRSTKAAFAVVIVGMTIAKANLIFSIDWRVLVSQVVIVASGIGMGLLAAWATKTERRALGMTAGIHNIGAAFLVVGTRMGDGAMLSVLTYSLVMMIVTVPVSHWLHARTRNEAPQPDDAPPLPDTEAAAH